MTKPEKPKSPPLANVRAVHSEMKGEFKSLGGSESDNFNHALANQAAMSQWIPSNASSEIKDRALGQAVHFMMLSKPADEIEGMLLAQMMAAHSAAMECSRRAMISEQTVDARQMNIGAANKSSRTFTTLLDALQRYRGKGGTEQRVTVQHQHVNVSADQAVIGINQAPPGGGTPTKAEEPAHALAYAPESPMRMQDAARDAVSIAGGTGAETLPHARRRQG